MAVPENQHLPGPASAWNAEAAITLYSVVKLGAAEGGVIVTAGDNEQGFGVAYEAATAANQKVSVVTSGLVWCRAAAAITIGAWVMAASTGEIKDVAAVADTLYYILGKALTAGAAANEYVLVLWQPHLYTTESS